MVLRSKVFYFPMNISVIILITTCTVILHINRTLINMETGRILVAGSTATLYRYIFDFFFIVLFLDVINFIKSRFSVVFFLIKTCLNTTLCLPLVYGFLLLG